MQKINILRFLLISILLFSSFKEAFQVTYSLNSARNQNVFNSELDKLLQHNPKSEITKITWYSPANISNYAKLVYLKFFTNCENLDLHFRYHRNEESTEWQEALTPLVKLKKVRIVIDHSRVRDLQHEAIVAGLNGKNDIENLEISFYNSFYITNADSMGNILVNMTLMKKLNLNYYNHDITSINTFSNSFSQMNDLEELHLTFSNNEITDITSFSGGVFDHLDKCKKVTFNVMQNDIKYYPLANAFSDMDVLQELNLYIAVNYNMDMTDFEHAIASTTIKTLRFYTSNTLDDSIQKTIFQHAPNIENCTVRIYRANQIETLNDLLENLPKLKRLEFQFYENYDLVDFNSWYGLFLNVPQLEYLKIYLYNNYVLEDVTGFTQMLSPLLNVNEMHIVFDRNQELKQLMDKLHVPNVKKLTIQFEYQFEPKFSMVAFQNCFETMEYLEEFYFKYQRSKLRSDYDGLQNFCNLFYSMYGLENLRLISIDFYDSKHLSDFNFMLNAYDRIPFKGRLELRFRYNSFASLDGLTEFMVTTFDPKYLTEVYMYGLDNGMSDVSDLATAFTQFSALTNLDINLKRNKFSDIDLVGLYTNKPNLTRLVFYHDSTDIADQRQFIDVLDPIYYYGKCTVGTQYFSFVPHGNRQIGNLNNGNYITQQKDGYCVSNYSQAYLYSAGTCLSCHNKYCHVCQNTSECERCRYSTTIERNLPDCFCPERYYDAPSNYDCLKCLIGCQTCNDGVSCLTCRTSNPARIMPECTCPDGYYDNGDSDQCQECLPGCRKCVNGDFCTECKVSLYPIRKPLDEDCACPSGYYDIRSNEQCLKCKKNCFTCQFPTSCDEYCNGGCLTCSGTPDNCDQCAYGANRSMVMPDCKCLDGYFAKEYENIDCEPCDVKCKTCENQFKCFECVNPNMLPPYCISSTRSYYSILETPTGHVLEQCDPMCKICETESRLCKECLGDNRDDGELPGCPCLTGYHDNNRQTQNCEACPRKCEDCVSNNLCTKCFASSHRELNHFTGNCECKSGYTETVNEAVECVRCFYYQGECFTTCPGGTFVNQKTRECQNLQYEGKEHSGFIWAFWVAIFLAQVSFIAGAALWIKKRFVVKWKAAVHRSQMKDLQKDSSDEDEGEEDFEKDQDADVNKRLKGKKGSSRKMVNAVKTYKYN